MKRNLGIYIHIPFCIKKCSYCDFISFENKLDFQGKYIEQLKKEIESQKEILKNSDITTIYIGGGTPSAIKSKYIVEIINYLNEYINFKESNNIEITIEVNPGTVTKQKLTDYYNSGINRISIGLQCVQDRLLKIIGRIHNFEQFLETFKMAREVGFKNINVDLMIGLPEQNIEDIKQSIEKILELNPEHISVYSLIVEEGTKISKKIEEAFYQLPDEELERMEYSYVKNKLELAGYNHYEISNFAKEGFFSKHNLNCWKQEEYLGFGIAAHSYYDNIRFSNTIDLNKYLNAKSKDFEEANIENMIKLVKINSLKEIHEVQSELDKKREYMLLGLRTLKGVSITEFKQKFIENPIYLFRKELEKLVNEELIEIDLDYIKLTRKGLDLANLVWEEFV